MIRELGRGGMGVVYVVEHVGTGDELALKVMTARAGAGDKAVERFKREARAPAKIKSEHVVRVTDADVAPELGGAPSQSLINTWPSTSGACDSIRA